MHPSKLTPHSCSASREAWLGSTPFLGTIDLRIAAGDEGTFTIGGGVVVDLRGLGVVPYFLLVRYNLRHDAEVGHGRRI